MTRDLRPVHITGNKRNMWADDREKEKVGLIEGSRRSILTDILALKIFYFQD